MSNLAHAQPELSPRELRRLARINCRRLIEMGLFAVYSGRASKAFLEERITFSDDFREAFRERSGKGPLLALLAHNTLTEMMIFSPILLGFDKDRAAALYRPLNQPALDRWVKETRERGGLRLISRRTKLDSTIDHLRKGGYLAILADQSAGSVGILGRVAGRTASLSPLPDLIARRTHPTVVFIQMRRTGFFRGELHATTAAADGAPVSVQFADWIGTRLIGDPDWRTDWLWMHKRWKTQRKPSERLRLSQKRGFAENFFPIPEDRSRADRFILRLPNWLGDVVMVAPLVRAIRNGRPDVHITLACRPTFEPLIRLLDLPFDDLLLADSRTPGGKKSYRRKREKFPDTALLFTNSFRGDRELKLTGAEQRFGILRKGKPRPFLTHAWKIPENLDEQSVHQTDLFHRFLTYFGLREEPVYAPTGGWTGGSGNRIGLICGSENAPEKRWPVESWRVLIQHLLAADPRNHIELYGTPGDRETNAPIAAGLGDRVLDLTGKTDLAELGARLRRCRQVVGNDTGGIHLANALGVPTVVLFGPTNPVRTKPVFDAPVTIIQAPDARPTGGGTMASIPPERVIEAIETVADAPEPPA